MRSDLLRHLRDVLAVDQDAAVLEFEEAQQQVDQRRLAGTGTPDQADLLAGLDGERESLDQTLLAAIAEPDVLETRCRRV